MARVLVVDDERSMREYLEILLRKMGHVATTVADCGSALRLAENQEFDLVLSDLRIGKESGIEVLRAFKTAQPDTEVVMITAFATMENAIEAMKLGAYDYVTKPFKNEELWLIVQKALEKHQLQRENESLRIQLSSRGRVAGMVGDSAAMKEVYSLIEKVAQSRTTVLVVGESGVGKELVARAVHSKGPRATGPFVPINCGAIPEGLVESELFGHVRGAFTGATVDRPGLFKAAGGGTIFLDEVGELPLPTQVKLLRAIQDRRVKPVGGNRDIEVDARIIAATNRDLAEEVKEGRFREDLYYRLNVIQVFVPPLRRRREDILPLAEHFIAVHSSEKGCAHLSMSKEASSYLQSYDWPGNVRELENAIERAVTLTEGAIIQPDMLPPQIRGVQPVPEGEVTLPPGGIDLQAYLDALERRFLQMALVRAGGVKKEAAKLLGLTFRSMRYRLAKQGLSSPRSNDGDDGDE
ncbi:MAG TPA: Fis family transcriptional regulator [Myxococcales bacterium]|jgi:two-component system response regulator PilR (NtrC family)|nr:Fis family transcriptional regulator [Myxococcales bacterium]